MGKKNRGEVIIKENPIFKSSSLNLPVLLDKRKPVEIDIGAKYYVIVRIYWGEIALKSKESLEL